MSDNSVKTSVAKEVNLDNIQSHKDIKLGFLYVLNAVQPEHSYLDADTLYPIKEYNIEYSYKQSDSPYYASCGPKSDSRKPVFFAADKKAISNNTPERNLAIYIHELTHLNVGSHTEEEHGGHPPRFWREFAFNAHKSLDNWSELEKNLGITLSKQKFIGYIIDEEINSFNIDQRYHDVHTLQHQMARWFESTLR